MIISKTPLRASFFGGGTDFHNYFHNSKYGYGTVISTTIDKYVYIIVNKRFDKKIRIIYNGNELVDSVDEIKHNIIREALKITNISEGIEIIYIANLPMTNLGIGLASSSALAVGTLNALHHFKNENVTKEQLAKEAWDLEINKLGQQIGIQDQYAVAYGGFNQYKFLKNDTVEVIQIENKEAIKNFKNNLMLFYTGSPRDSKQIFTEQKKNTEKDLSILNSMVEIANKSIELINNNEIDNLGFLLNEAWQIKKKFATGVSNDTINNMYEKAKNAGALGGKILGAGGGGFMLLYVTDENKNKVRNALSEYQEISFEFDNSGSTIVYED